MNQINISTLSLSSKQSKKDREISWPEELAIKQRFSLPDSIIYYIAKNSSSPEVYQKLAHSCKYFFEKNPILIIARIHSNEIKFCSENGFKCLIMKHQNCCTKFDINKLSSKIWLTIKLNLTFIDISTFIPLLAPKIYRCEKAEIYVFCKIITLKEFQLLALNFVIYDFHLAHIVNHDGSPVMFDSVLEAIPNVYRFSYSFNAQFLAATAITMKNVNTLTNLNNLHEILLYEIPEVINIKDLGKFIKKQKRTKIRFHFSSNLSDDYMNQLDSLIDIVINSGISHRLIYYYGQNEENLRVMQSRYIA